MFGFFKKSKQIVVSPVDGDVVDIESVPDKVFSQKLAGDGVAIVPNSGTIVAPIDGVVSRIFPTNHAFLIINNSGLEVMVHVGIDTVELNGEGFERLVEEGDKVKFGCPILSVDFDFIQSKGKAIITPVIVTCDKSIVLEKHKIGTIREGESLIEVKFT
ncbi:PTS glucose transporter subunit IIA [Sulfurovum sp. bin170]|uniref:PTS sugar transporter subunit IIA n=1 Tax=Sulfurovum sp. bin170 TaxID=2695268 RepID=UPI0013DFD7EB|nr:PTS glucose transporter subunit IIA [Sulfurovum sp. bin170]